MPPKSQNLKKHKGIHTGERPLDRQSQNLKKHKGIHTGERPFKCDECPKAFRQSQNLKKHKGIHTGERPFKCDECPKAFRYSNVMRDHSNVMNAPKRLEFKKSQNLMKKRLDSHKGIHTGERPFHSKRLDSLKCASIQERDHSNVMPQSV